MTVLDTMLSTTPHVRRVTLCLDGGPQAEYDALLTQLSDASVRDATSLAGGETAAVVEHMEAVRERMAKAEVAFMFKALPWLRRLTLQGEHPAREDNVLDRYAGQGLGIEGGYNTDTYPVALIRESLASVQGADGEVVTDIPQDVLDTMLERLNFKQVDVLFSAATQANDMATTPPPSARALLKPQDSGASSKSPGPGTSPQNGSKAGSRRGSRKSTATKKAASSGS